MQIKSLNLKNFRNYELLKLTPGDGANIFYGDNAQGKTNILEAVYLAGTTKSHRGSRDKDMIRFGSEEAHIEMIVEKRGLDYQIDMHLRGTKSKGVAVNKIPIKKAGELFGVVNLVFFSPEDLNVIKNGPAERRRFIDMELSQLDKVYFNDLSNYHKILNQRNQLLKDLGYKNQDSLMATLDVWDMQLVEYGNRIIKARGEFMNRVNEIIGPIHRKLTGEREEIRVIYEPSNGEVPLDVALDRNRERDLRVRSTSVGPHRDDVAFMVGELDIRRFGSQGQQRTAALSLKLSEIELVKQSIHDTPVLLLDDVLSELDKNRQNYLLDSISDIQTLITCTGVDEFVNHRFSVDKIFHVQDGHVEMQN